MTTLIFKSSNFSQSIQFFKSSNYQNPIRLAKGPPVAPSPFPFTPYVGRLWTFNNSGTFTAGYTGNIQVVVVAGGGGGGGGGGPGGGGGGGGGGVTYCTAVPVTVGTNYTVTVGNANQNSSFVGASVNLVSIAGGNSGTINFGGGGGGSVDGTQGQPVQAQTPPVSTGTTFVYGLFTNSRGGGGTGGRTNGDIGGPGITLPSNFGSIKVAGGGGGGAHGSGGPGGGGNAGSPGITNTGGGGGYFAQGAPGIVLVYDGPNAAIPIPPPYLGQLWTFNSSGTFTAGYTGNMQVVVVAGGGGGSPLSSSTGISGGGGGGVTYCTAVPITQGTNYTVTVGNGGTGTSTGTVGNNGLPSSFIGPSVNLVSYGGNGGSNAGAGGAAGAQPAQIQNPPVASGTTFIYGFVNTLTAGGGAGGKNGSGLQLPSNFGSIVIGGGGAKNRTVVGNGGGGGGSYNAIIGTSSFLTVSPSGTANTGGGGAGGFTAPGDANGGSGVVLIYDGLNNSIQIPGPPAPAPGSRTLSSSLFPVSTSQTFKFTPEYTGNIQVLVAGGGGNGGSRTTRSSANSAGGGGGGGGVVICNSYPIVYGVPIEFTVGAANSPSTFGVITAFAGGLGGSGGSGAPGGSSGGSAASVIAFQNVSGPATQGSAPGLSATLLGSMGGTCPSTVSLPASPVGAGGGGGAAPGPPGVGGAAPIGDPGGAGGASFIAPAIFNSFAYGAGGAGGGNGNPFTVAASVIGSGGGGCPALNPAVNGSIGSAGDVRIFS
jgi:hypothetical protein